MSETVAQHKQEADGQVACAVITVSDTRTLQTDRGGDVLVEMVGSQGHTVVSRRLVPDEPDQIAASVRELVQAGQCRVILLTGGTGISARDQTFETISAMLDKPLPGYGELFRMLSYEEIGSAAMLSRATGGMVQGVIVLTMPGSPNAIRLAMEKLILPELKHLVHQATK